MGNVLRNLLKTPKTFYFNNYFVALYFLISSVNIGNILCKSPTIPKSATEKIGANLSLFIAIINSDSSIPATC